MAEYKFYLKQPPASELVDKLLSVIEEVSPDATINYFSLSTNIGNVNFANNQQLRKVSTFKNRLEPNGLLSFLTSRPYVDVTGLAINTNADLNFSIGTGREFYIQVSTGQTDYQKIAPISDALNKHFNLIRTQEAHESYLPQGESSALKTAQTILLDFSSQAARLSQLSASNTERMNEIIIQKTGELDARYEERRKELEEREQVKVTFTAATSLRFAPRLTFDGRRSGSKLTLSWPLVDVVGW